MKDYVIRVLLAFDIFINVVLGGEFETISARCGRHMVHHPYWRKAKLPVWWIEHCLLAHQRPLLKRNNG